MGEAKRRRSCRRDNEVDGEGLLTRIAGHDMLGEDRRGRAVLTDVFRDLARMADAAGGAGFIGTRDQAAANIAGHCIVAEAVGYGVAEAYLTDDGQYGWGGRIHYANGPRDLIGPPTPVEMLRRVLMQLSGFCGECAAKVWRAGSCLDDQVVSLAQTEELARALGAPDRVVALRMKLWIWLVEMLSERFGTERAALEGLLRRHERLGATELAGVLSPVMRVRLKHGDCAIALAADLRGALQGAPTDEVMAKAVGETVPSDVWRAMRGGEPLQ
jgi:hypothetical protein